MKRLLLMLVIWWGAQLAVEEFFNPHPIKNPILMFFVAVPDWKKNLAKPEKGKAPCANKSS